MFLSWITACTTEPLPMSSPLGSSPAPDDTASGPTETGDPPPADTSTVTGDSGVPRLPPVWINEFDGLFLAEIDGVASAVPIDPRPFGVARPSPSGARLFIADPVNGAPTQGFDAATGALLTTVPRQGFAWLDDTNLLTGGEQRRDKGPIVVDALFATSVTGAGEAPLYDAGDRAVGSVTTSPDGAWIAFTEVDQTGVQLPVGPADIVSFPVADPTVVARAPSGLTDTSDLPLAITADQTVVWAIGDVLYTAAVDLSASVPHATGAGISANAALYPWSTDDTLLWFDASTLTAHIVDTDGSVRAPFSGDMAGAPALSPDRTAAVFARRDGAGVEWLVTAPDGSAPRPQVWDLRAVPVDW